MSENQTPASQWLTLRESSKLAKVAKSTIWRAVQRGEIAGVFYATPPETGALRETPPETEGDRFAQYWLKAYDVEAWAMKRKTRGTPERLRETEMPLHATLVKQDETAEVFHATVVERLNPLRETPETLRETAGALHETPEDTGEILDASTLKQALDVANKALDRAQSLEQRLDQERELRERAERHALALAEELGKYRRALTETSESLAEARAQVQAAELAAAIVVTLPTDGDPPPETLRTSTPTVRRGWKSRVRRWLLGERAG